MEEKESEVETSSKNCDYLDEIESIESFEVLVESKPFPHWLAKDSLRPSCFPTVYSKNQKKKLKKQYKGTSSHFDQEETFLLNQVKFDIPKLLCGRPKRVRMNQKLLRFL